ncbi:MAG: PEGA domain-containing protein, partial [Candidatus Brocadiaceae bacterium]|nr:PEGA domain-containing protein [Candidatus Brocadiaceae bacterium]
RASYKILEGVQGGTLVSDTIKVSKSERLTERSHTENSDMVNELLDEAACKIAESLGKKQIIQPPPKPNLVEITIACGMQDLAQLPVSVPDLRMTKEGKLVAKKDPLEVQLLDVTVELNGTVIGSAPGVFKVPPGLSKIRLTREGFKDWERTINANEGQKLKVVLQMTDNGYKRWRDNTAFLQELKDKEKLTDAEVESIKGHAQMLRQSGFKVDVKEDVKGDIKKGTFNSIFGLLFLQ